MNSCILLARQPLCYNTEGGEMYTKQMYEEVAELLAQEHRKGNTETKLAVETLAFKFAVLFKRDNPSFSRERFMQACEIGG